jgi:DNA-binding transcriptional LysR family regulator
MLDWNDLRFFLAVARRGSTMAAARMLDTSQTTVQRRLANLEAQFGQTLVERNTSGYRLTATGRLLVPYAEGVETAVQALERRVAELSDDLVGVIRVTCPEPMGYRISQSGLIERFHQRHPKLRVELVLADRFLDISKGEADVAIRSGESGDQQLVGRKIAVAEWALYASRDYIRRHGQPRSVEEIAGHSVVAFDKALSQHRAYEWIDKVAPNAKVAARNDSVLGALRSVQSGAGIAPLPIVLAEEETDLVYIFGPINEVTRDWRLLTRPELRQTPRIAAFFEFMSGEIAVLRRILTEPGAFAHAPAATVKERRPLVLSPIERT